MQGDRSIELYRIQAVAIGDIESNTYGTLV